MSRFATVRSDSLSPSKGVLLEVRDLRTTFATEGGMITAVDGVSLRIPRGKTVALVGESGCGKSVTALSMLRLLPRPPGRIASGQVLFTDAAQAGAGEPADHPVDLLKLGERRMRSIRGNRIAMVFQDPMSSLNPVMTIGEQIVEAIELHRPMRGATARSEAVGLLRRVGVAAPKKRIDAYPHEMSGGMLQRAMIAMALSCQPALLIADEPTTALDVTIQLQILELLRTLQQETGMSVLIITHDLGVVAEVADDVYVMYAGRIVEHASVGLLLSSPLHPYTLGLLRCVPRLSETRGRLEMIPGQVPDPAALPTGCRFHPRCILSADRAAQGNRVACPADANEGQPVLRRCVEPFDGEPSGEPELREVQQGHFVACWEVE